MNTQPLPTDPMQISTVIFDYGCVLSLAPTPHDYEPLREAIGIMAAELQEVYWRNRDAYDRNLLGASGYWEKVAQDAGVNFSPDHMEKWAMLDCEMWGKPNHVMINWVRVLRRRGLKTGVLSNISRYVGDYLRRTAQWVGLFDNLSFSGELGVAKPDPAFYHASLKALGVQPAEALFIDDREVNVLAAQALGMPGVLFRSEEHFPAQLEPYGLSESWAEVRAL
jgi:putative hydrolase of the HAD superfamily